MKKLVSLVLAAVLVLSLVACGGDAFKGKWVGTDDNGSSGVTWEFDGNGKVTNFDNTFFTSTGTYVDNKDNTITITLEGWDSPKTFVYDLSDGILTMADIEAVAPGYNLAKQ